MPTLPLVVIVTGVPASGKTTLAGQLAAELRLPLFCKDQIKETLFDTLGTGERPWSRKLGAASNEILYRIVESQLSAGRSCIVESNFQSEYASARFQTLRDHTPFQIAQVLCTADGQVLLERFRARTRHPGHLDHVLSDELVPELTQGRAEAIAIEGTVIEVDTTNPEAIPLAEIVARLRGLLGGELPRSARIVRD